MVVLVAVVSPEGSTSLVVVVPVAAVFAGGGTPFVAGSVSSTGAGTG